MPESPESTPAPAPVPALENIVVVLNETQDLVNIAGTVRAMANMGLRRLRLVNPVHYDEYRVLGIAHQGHPVTNRIEQFSSLDAALEDAVRVVGTSARRRTARFVWQHPREAAPALASLAVGGHLVALLFGREDIGLDNAQLDRCDEVITVPTDPAARSMNLAQAVLLIAYELFIAAGGADRPLPTPRKTATPASWSQHQQLFDATSATLQDIDFYKGKNPEAVMRTIRAVARRAQLDSKEANLFRAIAFETRKVIARLRGDDAFDPTATPDA